MAQHQTSKSLLPPCLIPPDHVLLGSPDRTLSNFKKRWLLDSERSGCQHPRTPTPRSLPPNGKQSLDSHPKAPFPSQPFPTPSPQHQPNPQPSQNRLKYG